MYSRNYFDTEEPHGIPTAVPENYVGTAFAEQAIEEKDIPTFAEHCEPCEPEAAPSSAHNSAPCGGSLLGGIKLPFLENLKIPEIGTEEILIIAVALFLLFSKNRDPECAVMLLLLLLVN